MKKLFFLLTILFPLLAHSAVYQNYYVTNANPSLSPAGSNVVNNLITNSINGASGFTNWQTIWFDLNGSDANPGTQQKPRLTLTNLYATNMIFRFGPGTFTCTNNLIWLSNVFLIGSGIDTTLLTNSHDVGTIYAGDNVHFQDITYINRLSGTGYPVTDYSLVAQTNRIFFESARIIGNADGAHLQGQIFGNEIYTFGFNSEFISSWDSAIFGKTVNSRTRLHLCTFIADGATNALQSGQMNACSIVGDSEIIGCTFVALHGSNVNRGLVLSDGNHFVSGGYFCPTNGGAAGDNAPMYILGAANVTIAGGTLDESSVSNASPGTAVYRFLSQTNFGDVFLSADNTFTGTANTFRQAVATNFTGNGVGLTNIPGSGLQSPANLVTIIVTNFTMVNSNGNTFRITLDNATNFVVEPYTP